MENIQTSLNVGSGSKHTNRIFSSQFSLSLISSSAETRRALAHTSLRFRHNSLLSSVKKAAVTAYQQAPGSYGAVCAVTRRSTLTHTVQKVDLRLRTQGKLNASTRTTFKMLRGRDSTTHVSRRLASCAWWTAKHQRYITWRCSSP